MNSSKEEHGYFIMPAKRAYKSSGQQKVVIIPGDDKEYDAKDIHWEVQRSPRHPIYVVKAEPEKVKTEKIETVKKKNMPTWSLEPYQACVTRSLNVIARNEKDGLYYAGHVLVTLSKKCSVVVFGNNEQQETKMKLIIPMGGSVPRPELRTADFVLMRVFNVDTEKECYVPGIVRHIPHRIGDQMKFYTIIIYNGWQTTTRRCHLVKIDQVRFYETVQHIAELQCSFKDGQKAEKEEKTEKSRSSSPKSKSRSRSSSKSRDRPTPVMRSEDRVREIVKTEKVTQTDIFTSNSDNSDEEEQRKISELEKELQKHQKQLEKQQNELLEQRRKIKKMRQIMNSEKEKGKNAAPASEKINKRALRELVKGEDVLACWSDDGWYYWGTLLEKQEDQIYVIEDQTRHQEEITRDHIFTDSENATVNLQHYDYVIAPHPEYKNSYAPGKVLSVHNREVEVKFYDDEVDEVDLGDVFAISSDQFESDVDYIRKCEKDFKGRKVLTRNDDNGKYFLGKVLDLTGSDLQYKIQCSDGATITQRIMHVFNKENMKRITNLKEKDYVLAKPNGKSYYIPAIIERLKPPNVKFCDGSRKIGSDDCLWLNEDYYKNAKNYYLDRARSQLDHDLF